MVSPRAGSARESLRLSRNAAIFWSARALRSCMTIALSSGCMTILKTYIGCGCFVLRVPTHSTSSTGARCEPRCRGPH